MISSPSKDYETNLKKKLKQFINAQQEVVVSQSKRQLTKDSIAIVFKYLDNVENFRLIQQYGNDIYSYSQLIDKYDLLPKYLSIHNLSNQIRTKMVDWMLEIFNSYSSEPKSFFLAVHILDLFITKTKKILCDEDIHLIGMCSIYIASKMEDIIPLHLSHIKTKIGHDKFSVKQIQKKEREILLTLDFDLIVVTTYDFIKTYLYDFYVNNKEYITLFDLEKNLLYIENSCFFLSKLIAFSDTFSVYK